MTYKYAYQGPEEGVAKAASTDVPISTKTAAMVARFVKGKTVERAERDLSDVLAQRQAVPFTRYFEGAGHKPGMGPGKYPVKATKAFLNLVRSVRANALDKGLSEELVIVSCSAHKGVRTPNYGRHRGRQSKSTHVEIVAKEADGAKPVVKLDPKKPAKKETPQKPKKEKEESKTEEAKTPKEKVEKQAGKAVPKSQKEEKKKPAATANEKPAKQTNKPKSDQEEKK